MDDDFYRRRGPVPFRPFVYSDSVPGVDDLKNISFQQFTCEDLKLFTNDFSDENFIGRTHFCNVYRGKMSKSLIDGLEEERVVTVKIWTDSVYYPGFSPETLRLNFAGNLKRFKDEVELLSTKNLSPHPNLVKLMGWCCEIDKEFLGAVYDLNTYDTLHNLIPLDILKWVDRIKIVMGLASLLKDLHNHQPLYLVLNLSAAHIMIDQDFNPVLLEFGMLITEKVQSGVIRFPYGAYGYQDPSCGGFTCSADVFSFGVILMELLRKHAVYGVEDSNVEKPKFLHHFIVPIYESLRKSKRVVSRGMLVEKSLMEDAGLNHHDEAILTLLAVDCAEWYGMNGPRPTMRKVVHRLKHLQFLGNTSWMRFCCIGSAKCDG